MWTPRRILLLLLGIAGFTSCYVAYAAFLGGVDGLPELPAQYLAPNSPAPPPALPNQSVSPTFARLREAFGPNCAEVSQDNDSLYKFRLEDRGRGMVFACGQPVMNGTHEVTVSPFSVAMFAKPKPEARRGPNEVPEISTFHADQAVLEFSDPVANAQDLTGAKLIGMKLLGVPELPSTDPRRGRIWVINNQRSADPGQHLVFHTPGPLYYEAPTHPARKSPTAPHVWTHAPVEVVDLRNLPRPLHAPKPHPVPARPEDQIVAAVRADDLRTRTSIADILHGATLPPPTITALGMNIYLEEDKPTPGRASPPALAKKPNNSGYAGVKYVELRENVQLNMWSDGGPGMVGNPTSPTPAAAAPPPPPLDPSLAATGLAGGLLDGGVLARRLEQKTLLVVDTLGSFRYDFDKNTARFETAPVAAEAVANFVTLARLSATGKQDDLSCKLLVIEFDGGPDRNKSASASSSGGGMKIKTLTATGPHVYISFEAEQLSAQGTELRYVVDAPKRTSTTILKGTPVIAIRDRNKLLGGAANVPAEVVIVSKDPAPNSKEKKQSQMSVVGPGRMDLYDEASGDTTLQATWGHSLTHEKELVGKDEQDLLKFEGGSSFVDTRGNMTLAADRLWLWLSRDEKGTTTATASATPKKSGDTMSQALPQRLLAVGHVEGNSPDMVIENTDQMTVWFRDVPPPAPPAPAKNPIPPVAAAQPAKGAAPPAATPPAVAPNAPPMPPPLAAAPPAVPGASATQAEKKKPPMHVSARQIVSRMVRFPQKVAVVKPGQPAPPPGTPIPPGQLTQTRLKYEMEQTICEDRVLVTQEPTDPAKAAVGVYISGDKLRLDGSSAGNVMTVTSATQNWAQVHYENLSLFGPEVVIDQPNNAANVKGRGLLRMPSESGDAGAAGGKPNDLEVHWSKSMDFRGTNGSGATAEFVGHVQAKQMPHQVAVGPRVDLAPGAQVRHTAFRNQGAAQLEVLAPPRPVVSKPASPATPKGDDGTVERSVVLCHQLDVTFDKPIYFNDYKPTADRPAPAAAAAKAPKAKGKDEERARLKTALCSPMPDEEADTFAAAALKRVIYISDVLDRNGKVVKAQRIDARQIDLRNEPKEKIVYAAGPGEVRLMQPGAKDEFGQPTSVPQPQPAANAKPPEQEMKLTVVKFVSRMVGTEKGDLYQEALFHDGARVFRFASQDLNQRFVEHTPPKDTLFLECSEMLTVSSSKAKKDAPVEQWMVAKGNGQFRTEEYEGTAATITYRDNAIVFDGERANARLYRIRRSVNDTDNYAARSIIYHRNGLVETRGTSSGSITSP